MTPQQIEIALARAQRICTLHGGRMTPVRKRVLELILLADQPTRAYALLSQLEQERGNGAVTAEYLFLGGVRFDEPPRYDLVIDRISHEVPFYRATLKRLALEGAIIINNPFWWSADDKFFNFSLARKLGVAVPRTVLLPQKDYIKGIVSESLRNLEFPLDWQAIIDYVGLPAIMKPFDGGGWKNVSRVNTLKRLLSWLQANDRGFDFERESQPRSFACHPSGKSA